MSNIFYGGNGSSQAWSERAFPKPAINASSLAVTPFEIMTFARERYTHGTAFAYRVRGEVFLVTAWHVASGRDFFTRQLNRDALIPSAFRMFIPGFEQNGDVLTVKSNPFLLELTETATKKLENPPIVYGFPVDLAVARLPIAAEKSGSFTSQGMNEFEWGFQERVGPPIHSVIGSDVFVLGYPLSTYEGQNTPIWKRGSLASEPGFQIKPHGAFLVDVNATGGMSGGPVVRRVKTFTADNKDNGVIQEFYDEAIVGIYSGRALSSSETSFVLGYGWPIDLVHEIISSEQCFSE